MKFKYLFLVFSMLLQLAFTQVNVTDIQKDESGNIIKISYYKDGSHGITLVKEKLFFEDGSVKNEINYNSDGALHGKWILYYDNGKKKIERQYYNGIEKNIKRYSKDGSILKVSTEILGLWDVYEFSWYHHDRDTGQDSLLYFATTDTLASWGKSERYEYTEKGEQIYHRRDLDEPVISSYSIRNDEIIMEDQWCESLNEPYKAKFIISGDTLKTEINWFECIDWEYPHNILKVTLIKSDGLDD